MLHLYHAPAAVCAFKARLALEEKGLNWKSTLLNLAAGDQFSDEYRRLNPKCVVPTLIHDEHVVTESSLMMIYLDEAFPEMPLRPRDPYGRFNVSHWMRILDDELLTAVASVSFAFVFAAPLRRLSPEQLDAQLGDIDPDDRQRRIAAIFDGVKAPNVVAGLRHYERFVKKMESALVKEKWLAGDSYSLADAAVTPFIYRADVLGLSPLWERGRPAVADWFSRIQARPSFTSAILDWLPPEQVARFKVDKQAVQAQVATVLDW